MSPSISPRADSRRLFVALHVAAFLSGFVTMALEMLIGRTFIPYFGGTIYTWGALISVFLTGMTLGYIVGGKAADRRPDTRIIAALFILAAATVMLVPLYGEAVLNAILDNIDDVRYAALRRVASRWRACRPRCSPPSRPIACVCRSIGPSTPAPISGRLSGLATAGSIIGTLGTSFFFIPTLGVRFIYGLLAGAAVLMGDPVPVLRLPRGRSAGKSRRGTSRCRRFSSPPCWRPRPPHGVRATVGHDAQRRPDRKSRFGIQHHLRRKARER